MIKKAFKSARAAYAANFHHHGDSSAAVGGAHIALIDAGLKFMSSQYMEVFECVLACKRQSVERTLATLESMAYDGERF